MNSENTSQIVFICQNCWDFTMEYFCGCTLCSRDKHLKSKPCNVQLGGISLWDVWQNLWFRCNRARNIKIIFFDRFIMKYDLLYLHIINIVNNRLKENYAFGYSKWKLDYLTLMPALCSLSTFILSFSIFLPFFLSSELPWVSFHQQNNFF